jgi:hypothetical protein
MLQFMPDEVKLLTLANFHFTSVDWSMERTTQFISPAASSQQPTLVPYFVSIDMEVAYGIGMSTELR